MPIQVKRSKSRRNYEERALNHDFDIADEEHIARIQDSVCAELAAAPFRKTIGTIISARTQLGGAECVQRIAREALQDTQVA